MPFFFLEAFVGEPRNNLTLLHIYPTWNNMKLHYPHLSTRNPRFCSKKVRLRSSMGLGVTQQVSGLPGVEYVAGENAPLVFFSGFTRSFLAGEQGTSAQWLQKIHGDPVAHNSLESFMIGHV